MSEQKTLWTRLKNLFGFSKISNNFGYTHLYYFRPKRDLTLEELNMLVRCRLRHRFANPSEFERFPEQLKQHFQVGNDE